jgi:hypothetical protein
MKNEFSISAKAKNLFLSLAESTAQTKCHFMLCLWRTPTWETTGLGKRLTNGLTCNDEIKIQTHKLRRCSLTLSVSKHQRGE